MFIRRLVIAMALVVGTTDLQGQSSNSPDLFSVPGNQLHCRQQALTSSDLNRGVGVALRFVEGAESLSERILDAGYSARGTPIYLAVMANVPAADRPFSTHAAIVHFGPRNQAVGLRIKPGEGVGVPPIGSRTSPIEGGDQLSEPENVRARELAEKLWNLGCGPKRSPAQP